MTADREVPGQFSIVLHSHLPWLANHGRWPVGEEWLYQSWAGSYQPLFAAFRRLAADGLTRLQATASFGVASIHLPHSASGDPLRDAIAAHLDNEHRIVDELGRADAATLERIQHDADAGAALGVRSTPTFFVDGELVELRDFADVETAIEAALAE